MSKLLSPGPSSLAFLSLGALGVVYGDIGTSPLYAFRECFSGHSTLPVTNQNVLGVLSLIVWSLIFVISVKYAFYVLRADNRGEGGVLALMALAAPGKNIGKERSLRIFTMMGLFGGALLYGDGMLTPVITVLSAVEGLKVVAPNLESYVIPVTICILIFLFAFQRRGTHSIGAIFGPIMLVWFGTLGVLGARGLMFNTQVLAAFNPILGIEFLIQNFHHALPVLGSVFLVVTGGEALYADMGHFGRRPIQLAWYFVAFPGLILNYLGQGALVLSDPATVSNPFYLLAPRGFLTILVGLATVASVIASQALISGVFSLTRQALQMGYIPRMRIIHTSASEIGQIYIPAINWALLASTIYLVLTFRSSTNLAGAYGIAVAGTMVITTVLAAQVSRRIWNWSKLASISVAVFFLFFDGIFLAANFAKIGDGGWFPLLIGGMVFTLMTTWKKGRRVLAIKLRKRSMKYEDFIEETLLQKPTRVEGTAVFMAGDPESAPPALVRNLKHNKIIHERVILLTVLSDEVPFVSSKSRVSISNYKAGFSRVVAHFGFQETPTIGEIIQCCKPLGLDIHMDQTTFFLGRETILATKRIPGMALWREKLFSLMSKNAQGATSFFKIPPEQVIEIGAQIEI